MPGLLAHFFVCQTVFEELREDKYYHKFIERIDFRDFRFLGALGPDMAYYQSLMKTIVNMLRDKSDKPSGVDGWSYLLHSREPNIPPLKMIEIVWREADIETGNWVEFDDYKKLAFTLGYLTHIAADQTIHPLVNSIAGPYYKHGMNREKHREVEVFQDLFLYKYYKKIEEFPSEDFSKYFNICRLTEDERESYIYFLQKCFVESHCSSPSFDDMGTWLQNISTFLKYVNKIGMYPKRYQIVNDPNQSMSYYADYFLNGGYLNYFDKAVQLAKVYVKMFIDLLFVDILNDDLRNVFKSVIRNSDLTSPLEDNILEIALENYKKFKQV